MNSSISTPHRRRTRRRRTASPPPASHAAEQQARCASSCRSAPARASTPSCGRRRTTLTKALGGQPVVIENLPGAGGITGTSAIVKAAPDGNTIGVVSNNHAVNPSVFKKMPYDA